MKFLSLTKVHEGRFLTRYDIEYKTNAGKVKKYEMVSRKKDMMFLDDLSLTNADAVVMILENKEGDKLLLNREFRLAVGEWVYNFPSGIIDPGESIAEAAKRELKEETGLDLIEVKDVLPECYSAVGLTNEKNACVLGVADGTFAPSHTANEEIKASWFSKEELRKLVKTRPFASRCQTYCHLWSRE